VTFLKQLVFHWDLPSFRFSQHLHVLREKGRNGVKRSWKANMHRWKITWSRLRMIHSKTSMRIAQFWYTCWATIAQNNWRRGSDETINIPNMILFYFSGDSCSVVLCMLAQREYLSNIRPSANSRDSYNHLNINQLYLVFLAFK